jgi:large subunit ribosomal protein L3
MQTLIAKKLGMSQLFREDGTVIPVTVLQVGASQVAQVKTVETDGYNAIQIGYQETAKPRVKPIIGHTKNLKNYNKFFEVRLTGGETALEVGASIDLSQFAVGDFVKVRGTSKGKGFQGVVKRHHFRGGPASHGHKDNLRMPGSIGSGGMQRVFKGLRMGGRMGGELVTIKNLQVAAIDAEKGTISLKGAVPGARNGEVLITGSGKQQQYWN